MPTFTRSSLLVLFIATFLLPGCGYTLHGKVVRGDASGVEHIHQIDQRLKQQGMSNVEVVVRRDPDSRTPQLVGRTRTNASGEFSMRINEFGAGWDHEQWLVQARQAGFENASSVIKLPNRDRWQLLITLKPGTATPLTHEEVVEEVQEMN